RLPRHPPQLRPCPTRRSSDLAGLRIDLPHPRHLAVLPFELALDGEREDVDRHLDHVTGVDGLLLVVVPELVVRTPAVEGEPGDGDRKSTRLNSSHVSISYAVF